MRWTKRHAQDVHLDVILSSGIMYPNESKKFDIIPETFSN